MYDINFWPVLVASIVGFGISSLWYSPILFGKEWMRLLNMTDRVVSEISAKSIWFRYVIQFIFMFIAFCVLAFAVVLVGLNNGSDGAFVGFLIWLGFMVPVFLSGLLWKKEPFKLVLIDAINNLVIFTIGGAIIGTWR